MLVVLSRQSAYLAKESAAATLAGISLPLQLSHLECSHGLTVWLCRVLQCAWSWEGGTDRILAPNTVLLWLLLRAASIRPASDWILVPGFVFQMLEAGVFHGNGLIGTVKSYSGKLPGISRQFSTKFQIHFSVTNIEFHAQHSNQQLLSKRLQE